MSGSSTDKTAATTTVPEDPSTAGLKQSIVTIVICVIALALYATSFIFTSYTLGGGKDHNTRHQRNMPGIYERQTPKGKARKVH